MRKILIFATLAFLAIYSCKKEAATNSFSNLQTLPKHSVSATGLMTEPLGVDLTGFQLFDMCSSEICTTLSGTAVFYIAFDGSIKPLCVTNFVYRYRIVTICRGEYEVELEPFTLFGEVGNTYKLIFTPRSMSTNKVIFALVRINVTENGLHTIQIDSGALKCP